MTTNKSSKRKEGGLEAASFSRRSFVKYSATLATVPFLASQTIYSFAQSAGAASVAGAALNAVPNPLKTTGVASLAKVVSTCSSFDCGGKCDIRAHVDHGMVTRITTMPDGEFNESMPIMRACVRGRGYRKFVYHPDRLKYPMKRVGKRGEGKFERITWDEATTLIADNMKRITEKYGAASRYIHLATGASTGGILSGNAMLRRLLNLTGGYLPYYHSVSMGNTAAATPYTYGVALSGNTLDTLEDTKLVILWGHNPTETIFGHANHYFQKMKQNGTRFIVVDPRYSDTASSLADQWIALLPTTDNALMDAMMHTIVTEGLHDQDFIGRYTIGFDEDNMPEGVPANESLLAYLTGLKDGVEKTAEWAEKITKVPAQTIRQLARDYATTKPAALIQGWGPQRHICGERTARASTLLASITGNVGIKGGWAGGFGVAQRKSIAGPEAFTNPIKESISIMGWVQAADDASKVSAAHGLKNADQLSSNIRMLFSLGGNYLANQNPDINQTVKVLEDESKIEFIVASDLYLTPSAKYADVLLPETSFMERWNIGNAWGSGSYFILAEKLIEPDFERRTDYEWLREVAQKMGVEPTFSEGRDEKQWLEHLLNKAREVQPEAQLPTFEELQVKRRHLFEGASNIAFEKNIRDPQNNPFPTPSGKIEIFSKRLYDMQDPEIPALSHYVPAIEGPEDALTEKYPLQLITWKGKNRANSTQYVNPWLQEVLPQTLWINPSDAKVRHIAQGDLVRIFNDRGISVIAAEVTPRIVPGVVALQVGAWWQPDEKGIDRGGCANVLTSTRITALAKGNSHKTLLVDVVREGAKA